MPPERYDPHSVNAMFGTVLERLETQDKDSASYRTEMRDMMEKLLGEFRVLHDRVTSLETWRTEIKAETRARTGILVLLAGGVSSVVAAIAWVIDRVWFSKP